MTDMSSTFEGASAFNQSIGRWDVSSVTNMQAMFLGASAFEPADRGLGRVVGDDDVRHVSRCWRVSTSPSATGTRQRREVRHVSEDRGVFRVFNQPIGHWDTGRVTDMGYMFNEAAAFNQPIGRWDVSSVTDMYAHVPSATRSISSSETGTRPASTRCTACFSGRRRSTSRSGAGCESGDRYILHVRIGRGVQPRHHGLDRVTTHSLRCSKPPPPGSPSTAVTPAA